MRWREVIPNPDSDPEKFRIIGNVARKWDKAKTRSGFDEIIRTLHTKYHINVSYTMSGIALHGLLHTTPIEVIMDIERELENVGRF